MSLIMPVLMGIGITAVVSLMGYIIGEGILRFIPWNANRLIRKRYWLPCAECAGRVYINRHPKHNAHSDDCNWRMRK